MYKRLLVPVDGSGVSLRGLDVAVSIVKATGGQLRVLHVIDGIAFAKQYNVFTATTDLSRNGKRTYRG